MDDSFKDRPGLLLLLSQFFTLLLVEWIKYWIFLFCWDISTLILENVTRSIQKFRGEYNITRLYRKALQGLFCFLELLNGSGELPLTSLVGRVQGTEEVIGFHIVICRIKKLVFHITYMKNWSTQL